MQQTDALLLQARLPAASTPAALRQARAGAERAGHALRDAMAAFAPDPDGAREGQLYLYLHLLAPRPLDAAAMRNLEAAWSGAEDADWTGARASRLERVFAVPGAAAGTPAAFHYVVEMDPTPGSMAEVSAWYDQEHMPGLAAVPGCVQAARYLNHDHGPLSLACYDLVRREAYGSPPWLAVRATDWSSRMRPHFLNTRRTMFSCL